jgi:hypothetical protein
MYAAVEEGIEEGFEAEPPGRHSGPALIFAWLLHGSKKFLTGKRGMVIAKCLAAQRHP